MLSTVDLGTAFTTGPGGAADGGDLPARLSSSRLILPHPFVLRRQLNVLVAAAAIGALWPVMLLIAAGLKLVGTGPVMDREIVVGLDRRSPLAEAVRWRRVTDHGGRLFPKYTFRDPATARPPSRPRSRASRVVAAGLSHLFRSHRLDELPLLFNVIRGDMNIVGPRPRRPEVLARLRRQDPGWARVQRVLPGITGAAQIARAGRGKPTDPHRQLLLELAYIDRQSVREDLRIMLRAARTALARTDP